jgi:3',5'-cyclic AMP phosphodiesterase CpdA
LSLDLLRRHYVDGLNEDPQSPINSDGRLTAQQFDALVADPVSYPRKTGSCGSCQSAVKSLADLTLEHCDKVRELAAQADSVVEFGMRHGVSTVALLAGQLEQMISYDLLFIDNRHTAAQIGAVRREPSGEG